MSANPFADPREYTQDANPFADPSVQDARHAHRLDDEEASIASTTKPGASAASLPAQQQGPDLSSRFEDLQRRETELARREEALTARAEHLRKHGRNNWPPGPFPLIYHDIDAEIPEAQRGTVRTLYRIWMFLVLTLIVNLVGAILLLIAGASNGGADLAGGLVYLFVVGVLSFFLWYRPVYNAYMKESSVFYIYFLFVTFHIAFCAYMFVGVPSSGSAGLINLISSFANGRIVTGVFCAIATAGWAIEGLASLWMCNQVYRHSHGEKGFTFSQAKQEFQVHGLSAIFFNARSF